MDNLPDGIIFTDTATRIIRVNKFLTNLFGLDDPAQAIGKTYFDFAQAEYVQQVIAENEEITRTGHQIVEKEKTVTLPDGRMLWVSITKMPFHDRDGNIIGTCAVSRDITQRKQAETALCESEERYRSVIAAMQDGIILLDTEGTIRACNVSAERILGLSADQITGRKLQEARWQAIKEDGSPYLDEARPAMVTLRTGQPCRDEVMGVHKPDGTLTWISVNSQPLYKADGTTLNGVVASFEDITERRKTEEALRQATGDLARLREQIKQVPEKAR
jgi:PAS domain S-box-containing protein